MSSKPIFYVYLYLRKSTSIDGEAGTPYYVGKGSYKRAIQTHHKGISVPKDDSRIIIYADNLSEEDAFTLEIMLIARYGRIDLGTGILRNKEDGGPGSSHPNTDKISKYWKGKKRKKKSKEHIERWKESMDGRYIGEDNPFYGKTHSDESKQLISKNNGKGQAKVTPEQVKEIRRIYKETKITQKELCLVLQHPHVIKL